MLTFAQQPQSSAFRELRAQFLTLMAKLGKAGSQFLYLRPAGVESLACILLSGDGIQDNLLCPSPLKRVPQPQSVVQRLDQSFIIAGAIGLARQGGEARRNLVDNVVDSEQIGLGFLQFVERTLPFGLVEADAGRFFE